MNLLPMTYYIAVVQNQSISRAARSLFITQQTLSAHVAAMEKELGCRLFERKPRFRLTPAGEIFYQYCLGFQKLNTAMTREFQDLSLAGSSLIRVGVSQTRSRILMPGVVARLRTGSPHLQLRLSEQTNEELIEGLLQGELDLMIGDVPDHLPELHTESLYRETMVLVAAKSLLADEDLRRLREKNDLRLLADYPFVMNSQNDIAGKYGTVILENAGVVPRVAVMSDSAETCLRMCGDGLGVYVCPDIYLRFFSGPRAELLILPQDISYPVKIAYRAELYIKRGVQELVRCCKDLGGEL